MRTLSREHLLYAGLTFLIVFASYVLTLAPTLTFWDAGEFIATSYILGVPHPPGTPLFVLMGHVFGFLPLGIAFAAKLNLMSALASSVGGFFYFLVLAQIVGRIDRKFEWGLPSAVMNGAALAAVCLSAWGLTVWYNSTETEVYTVALMTIALVTFLLFYWADHLREGKDWNLLLLIVFLMGLSIGNHLMALLVMPAAVVYVAAVVWPVHRDYLLSLLVGALGLYVVVMKGFSIDGVLAGTAIVNPAPMVVGLLVLAGGLYWMGKTGSLPFFLASVVCFVAGTSVILFLKIRAGLDPAINEANPETWKELLAVLGRKQYDVRPIWPRSVDFFRYQIPLYFDYFFGQIGPFQSRVSSQFGLPILSVATFGLAIVGSAYHYLADRKTWLYFLLVFLTTSLGLLIYLNFPLGNSQAPGVQFAREVRERDYFFIVSFLFAGLWAGVGVFGLFGEVWKRAGRPSLNGPSRVGALAILLLLPATVFGLNYHESDRRGNYIPRDFAYNVLESVEPWAILFTNGDNDTFPLWYLQEVESVRTDVAVVNLALLNTLWYLEQLDELVFTAGNPPQEVTDFALAAHGVEAGPRPEETIVDYSGTEDDPLYRIGYIIEEETLLDVAGIPLRVPGNSVLRRQDIGVIQIIRKNLGTRPIYFSVTVPDDGKVWLHHHLAREGIVDRLYPIPAMELARIGEPVMPMQPPELAWMDVEQTELMLEEIYRYRGMDDPAVFKDATARALVGNYGATYLQLAATQARLGETSKAIATLQRGHAILGRGPTDEAYVSSLINVFAVSGRFEGIDSLLRETEVLTGGRLDDRYYKTAAYNAGAVGHYEVADRLLEKYFREDRLAVEPDLWIELAEFALAGGDSSQAITFLSKAIRVDPNNQRAFLRHINVALEMGNENMAKTFLYQWVKGHPGDTVTARMYEEYLESGEFPGELLWNNIIAPPTAVDTVPAGG